MVGRRWFVWNPCWATGWLAWFRRGKFRPCWMRRRHRQPIPVGVVTLIVK